MPNATTELRTMIEGDRMVVAPFVYDAFQAKVAEKRGFRAVYMTGFGTAASRGYPDLGLVTMSEMVANARAIANAVGIPVICDADTGYGNPLNVWRTVREYEDAGAAAIHIEDQVWPKRCGFLAGKQVIPLEEMVPKVRAACDARRDPGFVIIARTDALAPNGWDDAERRARAYREAGADLVFVDGIKTRDDVREYATRLNDLPRLYNGHLLPVPEIARYGFKVAICSATLLAIYRGIRDAMRELEETGAIHGCDDEALFSEILGLCGVPGFQALEAKYAR